MNYHTAHALKKEAFRNGLLVGMLAMLLGVLVFSIVLSFFATEAPCVR